ncbi:Metallo-beta-lactamase superfamily protein [Halogranum gelatinilyticum]|uniref:Metallo-beta-lactamase superfamily protein n=1 Tax=Halogranum gelatinilyticum TaxID=660521 RepID=A0A1G9VTF0_9EURY|nr:N-acyl homoserine lactonase family protein [Halogranum gelatinilyticum]SDM75542.1 Metallo-beta-lactamase superfamily protein [Halogranum gelatinilyticum]
MSDLSVTPVDRGRVYADTNYVVDGYAMADAETPNPTHEMAEFVVWNAVVDGPETTVLWDTGSHPDAGDGYWPAPLYNAFEHVDAADHRLADDLDAAGYALDDIDAVVMSHLHLDHAGGLSEFAGTDVPIYVHEEELKFAYYSAKTTEGSIAYLASDFDHDLNWEIVHRHRHTLFDGFELLHLPGHTPGVMGAKLDLGDETLLIAGDECYVDANWADEAPLGPGLLWSERDWFESLQTLKELERRHDAAVLYGHDLDRFETLAERLG